MTDHPAVARMVRRLKAGLAYAGREVSLRGAPRGPDAETFSPTVGLMYPVRLMVDGAEALAYLGDGSIRFYARSWDHHPYTQIPVPKRRSRLDVPALLAAMNEERSNRRP